MALVEDTLGQKVTQAPKTLSNAELTQIQTTTTNTARPTGYYNTGNNGGETVISAPKVTVSSNGTKRITPVSIPSNAPNFTTTISADGTRTRTQLDSSTTRKISTERYNPSTGSRIKTTYTYGPDGKVKSSKATTISTPTPTPVATPTATATKAPTASSTPKIDADAPDSARIAMEKGLAAANRKSTITPEVISKAKQSVAAASPTYPTPKIGEPDKLSVYSYDPEEGWTTHASGNPLQNGYVFQNDGLYHVFVNGEEVGKAKNLKDADNLFYEKLGESSGPLQPNVAPQENVQEPIVSWYSGYGGESSSGSELATMSFTSALSAASLAPKPVIAVDTDDIQGSKWNLDTLLETLEEIIKEIQEIRNTLEQYNVLSGPIAEEILEMYSKLLKEIMNEVLTKFQSIDKFLTVTVPTLYGEADEKMASSYKTIKLNSVAKSNKTTTVNSSSSNPPQNFSDESIAVLTGKSTSSSSSSGTNSIKFYRIGN